MDAATHTGKPIGKKTSTAYSPPELARVRASGSDQLQTASTSFDVWSLGVMLFELCTGRTLFRQDTSNDDLVLDEDKVRLCAWQEISEKELEEVFPSAANSQRQDAMQVIRWCLAGDPDQRPTVTKMLTHQFLFHQSGADAQTVIKPSWRIPRQMHNDVEARRTKELSRLFKDGSAHWSLTLPEHADALVFCRAARQGDHEMVHALARTVQTESLPEVLSAQVPPYHYSPLHWCASYSATQSDAEGRFAKTAELLIKLGCKTDVLNHRGKTVWDIAEPDSSQPTHIGKVFRRFADAADPCMAAFYTSADVVEFQLVSIYSSTAPLVDFEVQRDLQKEQDRRKLRPEVADTFRDDLELEHRRFTLWNIEPFSNWGEVGADGRIVPLAEGGFGKVYLIEDVSPPVAVNGRLFRRVAMKVPKPSGVSELKGEVQSLGCLAHENVVQILGMVEGPEPDGSTAWMCCLEFCESDIARILYGDSSKHYSLELMLIMAEQIAEALVYIHSEGVAHLDLKPCVFT
jgi:serine/threonine protein kinase